MTTTFGPGSAYLTALDSVVSRLEAVEAQIRAAEAKRLELLAEALDIAACESENRVASVPSGEKGELAYRCVRSEVAAALHLSEQTVERKMSQAFTLTQDYASTFDAYRDGNISERHAAVIAEAGTVIGVGDSSDIIERRTAYEAAVLEVAVAENPTRLRPIARRLAEQHAERDLDERHADARRQRRVYLVDGEDGMSDLVAHLPAIEAQGIYARLTEMSRELSRYEALVQREAAAVHGNEDAAAVPPRCRDELRADLFTDILLSGSPESIVANGPVGLSAIRARVQVMVPVDTLQRPASVAPSCRHDGTDADPGLEPHSISELAGFGPFDSATARKLAGAASHWETVRIATDNGQVLSVDRYRPSEEMRRLLGARDQHCRFPGCRTPLARCDIDHTVDAQFGGETATNNLALLCRRHHTLKHHTGWQVVQRSSGDLTWRSPTGRVHTDRPPSRVRFVQTAEVGSDSDPPPF